MKSMTLGLTLSFLICTVSAQAMPQDAAAAPADAQDASAEVASGKVLVVGQRPGPGLWKVSKGDHVMWVLGLYSPLPSKLEWRSHEVEAKLAASQEFMAAPTSGATVGVLKGLTLLPHVIGLRKNPGGATLKDVLPADVYARWLAVKATYIGENAGIERERPVFAAMTLHRAGMQRAGLSTADTVEKTVYELVKKHNVRRTGVNISVDADASRLIKDFKKSSMEDVTCLTDTMDRLEQDLDAMRQRANAWTTGNVAVIEKTNFVNRERSCDTAMKSNVAFKNAGFTNLEERVKQAWVAEAERALSSNTSTFAMLRMPQVLRPDGYLAALEAKGYTVEKPE